MTKWMRSIGEWRTQEEEFDLIQEVREMTKISDLQCIFDIMTQSQKKEVEIQKDE